MEKKKQANFQRTKFYAFAKLGARQKSKRRYVRARGRHNKTRQKWRSRPPMVEAGYKNQLETRGLINGKIPVLVHNLADLNKIGKNNIAIIGKIGDKNKMLIAREIISRKIEVYNLNVKKFMKNMERRAKLNKKGTKTEDKESKAKEEKK